MIKRIYEKILKNKFFNKILIAYSLIIITTVSILVIIISSNISSILEAQSISFNRQILQSVNEYFEDKCRNAKNIHQQIIDDSDIRKQALYLLQYNGDMFSGDYIAMRNSFEKLMNNKLSLDRDISRFYLYNLSNDNYFSFYRTIAGSAEFNYSSIIWDSVKNNSALGKNYKRIYIHPTLKVSTPAKKQYHLFSMYDYIRDRNDISSILGAIVFDYDSSFLKQSYAPYAQYLKGHLMILTEEGDVIFDSSGNYYDKPFPMFKLAKNKQNGSVDYNGGVMNILRNSQYGFITIGVIPYSELYKDISLLKKKIFTISFISIIFILLLTYLSTRVFSSRIRNVLSAIRRIQKGDLSTRIPENTDDEIGQISSNLNHMCRKLNEYIEKEYISDLRAKDAELRQREAELKQNEARLRQKTAEMYALQSQINPHFLYNTLEVIRMKALSTGESDVSKMIKILAAMFRNSIKNEMVVHIKDEFDFCKSYLELYNIRFAGRLNVNFDIDAEILDFGIAKHLLQPIIENSIIHGIDLDQEGNTINIKGYKSENDIYIVISDNGSGLSEERLKSILKKLDNPHISTNESVGIVNVNYRIRLLYGDDYGLSIQSKKDIGTQVTVKISAKTREELGHYVQGIDC